MEIGNRESAYEKGVSLEEAVKSALQDTADCPQLPPDFAGRVEAIVGQAHLARQGRAFKIAASIAACVALAGIVFAAAVGGGLIGRGGNAAPDAVGGEAPIVREWTQATDGTECTPFSGNHKPTSNYQPESKQEETEMNIKKKTAVALSAATLAASSATVWAADATYTWPSVGSEIAVVYDVTDTTKVKSITATVEAGKTVTLTGGTINFAADAFVMLSGPGRFVVENDLAGVNGLMVTNAENACILDYKDGLLPSKTFKTIFPGVDLDDLTVLYGDQRPENGGDMQFLQAILYPEVVRRYMEDGVKMMSLQMQIAYTTSGEPVTKTVAMEMRQADDGVAARVVGACYPKALLQGEDAFNLLALWRMDPDATINTEVVDVAVKASDSVGTYGIGALTASWAGAPSVKLTGDLSGIGGALTVAKGAVADMREAAALPANQTVRGQFIVGDGNVTLSGTMAGANDGALVMAATRAGSYTVMLASAFNNTMAHTDMSYWNPEKTGERGHVIIKGDSAIGAIMTCSLQSNNGMPASGVVEVRDGGVLEFAAELGSQNGTLRQNGKAKYQVYTGGVLRVIANHAFYNKMDMAIELHGGILEKRRKPGASNANMNLYGNNLLFEDGARFDGDPDYPNLKLWVGGSSDSTWKVRGTSASSCNVPFQYVSSITHTIDVADVTGDESPDFVCTKAVGTQESNSGTSTVRKIGLGTVLCTSDVDIVGGLTVVGGTWQLGVGNIWKNSRSLTLNGGTFSVSNNTSNVIGTLMVGSRGGTIELGEGATLNFGASSTGWAGNLTIRGFRKNAIRFGENASAIDANLYKIRTSEGSKLHILKDGWLAPYGTVISIK